MVFWFHQFLEIASTLIILPLHTLKSIFLAPDSLLFSKPPNVFELWKNSHQPGTFGFFPLKMFHLEDIFKAFYIIQFTNMNDCVIICIWIWISKSWRVHFQRILEFYGNLLVNNVSELSTFQQENTFISSLTTRIFTNSMLFLYKYSGRSPAFLTSDDFVRSNEIVRTKWPIY